MDERTKSRPSTLLCVPKPMSQEEDACMFIICSTYLLRTYVLRNSRRVGMHRSENGSNTEADYANYILHHMCVFWISIPCSESEERQRPAYCYTLCVFFWDIDREMGCGRLKRQEGGGDGGGKE